MEAHGDGIQQLLAAENEAQQIIKAAREVRSCCARVAPVRLALRSLRSRPVDVGLGVMRRVLTAVAMPHAQC
jgi:hypothetical protein